MAITIQRIYDLITEHEETLKRCKEIYDAIGETMQVEEVPERKDVLKLVLATIHGLRTLPNEAHAIERKLYDRNARYNMRQREHARAKRRFAGVPQRKPPGSPAEVLAEHYQKRKGKEKGYSLPALAPEQEGAHVALAEKELAEYQARLNAKAEKLEEDLLESLDDTPTNH